MSRRVKTLLLGLDAACWDYLDPLIGAGELPHLSALMSRGIRGTLESTMPAWTPTAWGSIITGKNPGKHGAFDMLWRRPGTYEFEPANSRSRVGVPLWEYLNRAGLRVGLVNVPFLYPIDPLNGFALAGFGAPSGFRDLAYPVDILAAVEERLGPYHPAVAKEVLQSGNSGKILRVEHEHQARLIDAAIFLAEEHPVDVLVLNLMLLDHANHKLPEMEDVRAAIRHCDADIGRLLAELEPENVLLISDHGSKRVQGKFLLHGWLCERGYQAQEPRSAKERVDATNWILAKWLRDLHSATGIKETLARKSLMLLLPMLPERYRERLLDDVEQGIPFARRYLSMSERVDHTSTLVFPGSIYSGLLYFNVEGREPSGVVPPDRLEEFSSELKSELLSIKDPLSDRPLFSAVYRAEEIFQGPQISNGPDLVLDSFDGSWNIQTRHYTPRSGEHANGYFVGPQGDYGWHGKDGVYIFCGPAFRAGERGKDGSVMDIAPTLLHLLDIPIPDDYDGSSMVEAFTSEHLGAHEMRFQKADGAASTDQASGYSAGEARAVSEHLRALGYIE